jgi:hypothetical protein
MAGEVLTWIWCGRIRRQDRERNNRYCQPHFGTDLSRTALPPLRREVRAKFCITFHRPRWEEGVLLLSWGVRARLEPDTFVSACSLNHARSTSIMATFLSRLAEASELYLGGSLFESWPGHRLSCCTIQQAGRSRVRFPIKSLDLSIDLILPAALSPWGRLSL